VPLVASRRTRFKTRASKWNRAQRVIAIAQGVREVLLAAGVHAEKIVVIHSGIDIEESRNVPALDPPLRTRANNRDAFIAGNAGHLFEVKAQHLIPAAAAHAPGVHWFIAGEGPERAALEAAIAQHAVADRVRLLGWIADGRALLPEIDVYVSPATDEALGTMVLEAMARGIPVIAANAGGPAEILAPVHAQTGAVLIEPGNAAALAAAVQRIRDDAALRQRIIALQTERVKDFDSKLTAAATLAIYRKVLHG
jgi:glycosyltransferase involved in cell wall biosynthesis